METFFHVRAVISIILSMSMALILKGVASIIEHPQRKPAFWVHLLWAGYIFLFLIHFWWWEFKLSRLSWTFTAYLFTVFYITLFYFICSLLFPEDIKEYGGYKAYFESKRTWIFGVLALIFLVDVGDTLLKGEAYLSSLTIEYPIRIISHIILCILAIKIPNEKFQGALAIAFILYELSWIFRLYYI